MICGAVATAATTRGRPESGTGFVRTAAFLMLAAIVFADVIRVADCRSIQEDHRRRQEQQGDGGSDGFQDYMGDAAPEEDDSCYVDAKGQKIPDIITTGLTIEAVEGTTVNLPCKVNEKCLEEFAMLWINGTKTILRDLDPSTTDPRIKPGNQLNSTGTGYVDRSLIIEQVSRYDSGRYQCKVTWSDFEIHHTLRVIHPAKVLSVQAMGVRGSSGIVDGRKMSLKQGEPVQLRCDVAGYPEPKVQWVKRMKYQPQHEATTQSSGQDHSQTSTIPQTVVVSNTNEVRIEFVDAYRDAGYYTCKAYNVVSTGSSETPAQSSELELEIEFQPIVVVSRRVVNTGESYTAQMGCNVHGFPKVKVTWEKEQTSGGSPSWQPLTIDGPNSRYEITKKNVPLEQNAGNTSLVPAGPTSLLKVKQVEGPQDFGRYRCRAENRAGITYSDEITLTGSPAQPQLSYVQTKPTVGGLPELGWTSDSWSPVLEYQLQYRRQQDPLTSWTDVQPQPQVSEVGVNNAGDDHRRSISYTFGGQAHSGQHQPQSLEHGTTYVARLRVRNVHGWSEWSADAVFSGGMDDGPEANEISQNGSHQHNDDKVIKASTGSGASGPRQSRSTVATIFLAAATLVVAAKASVC